MIQMQRPSPITGAWWAAKIVALSFLLVIKIVAFFGYNWIIKLWQRYEQGIVTAKEWQSTAKSMANTGIKRKELLSSLYTEQAFCYNQKVLAEHPSFWGWQRPSFSAGNLSVLLLAHWDHLLSSYIYRAGRFQPACLKCTVVYFFWKLKCSRRNHED